MPLGSGAHIGLQLLMTVTSLFTDTAGNTPFLTTTVFVTANDHMIVASIYNYLFHYPFDNIFAHKKHLQSLPYLTSYKTSSLHRSNAMWKVIKVNKTFCKSTTVVLTEIQRVLKANPRVYLSGNNLANKQGKLIYCTLGNIIKNDA